LKEDVMRRALVGVGVGAICGVLVLAGFGAWGGYNHAHEWVTGPAPQPVAAAIKWAILAVAYFWWLAALIGGVIGGLAGLGSWLVRPRSPVRTRCVGLEDLLD
jgi:hypothetical protein